MNIFKLKKIIFFYSYSWYLCHSSLNVKLIPLHSIKFSRWILKIKGLVHNFNSMSFIGSLEISIPKQIIWKINELKWTELAKLKWEDPTIAYIPWNQSPQTLKNNMKFKLKDKWHMSLMWMRRAIIIPLSFYYLIMLRSLDKIMNSTCYDGFVW